MLYYMLFVDRYAQLSYILDKLVYAILNEIEYCAIIFNLNK